MSGKPAPPAPAGAAALAATAHAAGGIVLEGTWQFRQARSSKQQGKDPAARRWRAATVPGTVHTDLLAGETRSLRVESPVALDDLREALRVRSLADVLGSSAGATPSASL